MDEHDGRKLAHDMAKMDVLAGLMCIGFVVAIVIGFLTRLGPDVTKRGASRRNIPWFPHLITTCWACLYAAYPLSKILIYYGVPKALTFGYQIGKFAPTSCAASIDIEGPDGFPCSSKRFAEWLGKAFSGDGSLHLDEFETLGGGKGKIWGAIAMLLCLVALFLFGKWVSREDLKRMDRQDAEMGLKDG